MRVAVVILDWNDHQQTSEALRRIGGWKALAPSVWIVDNGSDEPFRAGAAARLVRSDTNRGFGGGVNLALKEILQDHAFGGVLLVNPDAEPGESDVRALVETMEGQAGVAVAGPALIEGDRVCLGGRNIARHVATRRMLSAGEGRPAGGQPVEVDYVPGTVALIRTSALRDAGLFDEDYFFSGEMADLCERMRREGLRCVAVPGAAVRHRIADAGGWRDTLYAYYSLRNRFLFVRKFGGRSRRLLCGWWVVVGLLMGLKAGLAGQAGKARAVWLALRDGMEGRFGDRHDRFLA